MPAFASGLKYDPKQGYLCTVLRYRHTVMEHVLHRVTFWVFLAFHICIKVLYVKGYLADADGPDGLLYVDWSEMSTISAITTFFEVFYTNECFKRYNFLYHTTRNMLAVVYDFATELRLVAGPTQKAECRLASRYLIASILLFFFEMDDEVSEKEWQQLIRIGILKPEERIILSPLEPLERTMLLLEWTAHVVCLTHAKAQDTAKVPPNMRKSLIDKIWHCRSLQHTVRDVISLPVPFQYFHLLKLMIVVNIFLWAYNFGTAHSLLFTVIFFLASAIFMGMMELASDLSDPFGNDQVDFPVALWLTEWLQTLWSLLESEIPGEADGWKKVLLDEIPLDRAILGAHVFSDHGFSDSVIVETSDGKVAGGGSCCCSGWVRLDDHIPMEDGEEAYDRRKPLRNTCRQLPAGDSEDDSSSSSEEKSTARW